MMKKFTPVIAALLITVLSSPLFADESDITVTGAWISEAPPMSKVMVAYMTILNNSDKEIEVSKAQSDLYSSIEFHETLHKDGMARMVRYDEISIPAHSKITFERGGKHFMLFNPTKHLKAGDTVNIKLTTSDNKTKTIAVPVKKAQY